MQARTGGNSVVGFVVLEVMISARFIAPVKIRFEDVDEGLSRGQMYDVELCSGVSFLKMPRDTP